MQDEKGYDDIFGCCAYWSIHAFHAIACNTYFLFRPSFHFKKDSAHFAEFPFAEKVRRVTLELIRTGVEASRTGPHSPSRKFFNHFLSDQEIGKTLGRIYRAVPRECRAEVAQAVQAYVAAHSDRARIEPFLNAYHVPTDGRPFRSVIEQFSGLLKPVSAIPPHRLNVSLRDISRYN